MLTPLSMKSAFSIIFFGIYMAICSALHPIIFVPGHSGSRLEAELNKTTVSHPWCMKKSGKYTIWVNATQLLPNNIKCYVDNMKLRYDNVTRRTYDADGVRISVPGFGDTRTIERLNPNQIKGDPFSEMVKRLLADGYERNKTIRGAPYDFRRAPNEQDDFFNRLKRLVEETYLNNGNKKVVLVGHSMGCDMLLQFFSKKVDQKWKDMHVKAFISLAGPYGGAVQLMVYFTVDSVGFDASTMYFFSREDIAITRSQTSAASFLPSSKVWKPNEVLISTPKRNYTVKGYAQFFKDINYGIGKEMWMDTKDLITSGTVPGVETHCIYGTGRKTTERLIFNNDFPDSVQLPTLVSGDGDGVVNRRSLEYCMKWEKTQKQKFYAKSFSNVGHVDMLENREIYDYILNVAK